MGRITDMVTQVSERLATMLERPEHTQTEANVRIRRQLTVFMGVKLSQQPGEVVFSSVLAAGPAEASGLIAGDRLVSIAGKPVTQIEDVFTRLRRYSPGDKMPLVVRRAGKPVEMEVRLRER
jgi:S1-C subfamily serine protease